MISHIKKDCYDLGKNNKFMILLGMFVWFLCCIASDPSVFHYTGTEHVWAIIISIIINMILNFLIFYHINLNNYGNHDLLVKNQWSSHDDYKIKTGKKAKHALIRESLKFPVSTSLAILLVWISFDFLTFSMLEAIGYGLAIIVIVICFYRDLCKNNTVSTTTSVTTTGTVYFDKHTKEPLFYRIDKAPKSQSKKDKSTDK